MSCLWKTRKNLRFHFFPPTFFPVTWEILGLMTSVLWHLHLVPSLVNVMLAFKKTLPDVVIVKSGGVHFVGAKFEPDFEGNRPTLPGIGRGRFLGVDDITHPKQPHTILVSNYSKLTCNLQFLDWVFFAPPTFSREKGITPFENGGPLKTTRWPLVDWHALTGNPNCVGVGHLRAQVF